MKKRGRPAYFKIFIAALLLLAAVFCFSACSSIKDGDETDKSSVSENHITENTTARTSETTDSTSASSVIIPSATTTTEIGIAFVEEAYVCSVWYDAVEGNPADSLSIDSSKATALRGVFYFNEPMTTVFQARLYKDKDIIMTRDIYMKDNVTAEADFYAGFEETDLFEPGVYYIELLFEDKPVATTARLKVK